MESFKSLKTVQTVARVIEILAKIGFIVASIGAVITLISGIVLLVEPSLLDIISMIVTTEVESESTKDIAISIIVASVSLAAQSSVLFFTARAFRHELEAGTPFTHKCAYEFISLGVKAIIYPILGVIASAIIISATGAEGVPLNEFDFIPGAFIIVMSLLLDYGADVRDEKEKLEAELLSTPIEETSGDTADSE